MPAAGSGPDDRFHLRAPLPRTSDSAPGPSPPNRVGARDPPAMPQVRGQPGLLQARPKALVMGPWQVPAVRSASAARLGSCRRAMIRSPTDSSGAIIRPPGTREHAGIPRRQAAAQQRPTLRGRPETDLDQRSGSILVRHGKNDRRREVGMDAWAWSALQSWLAERAKLPVGSLVLRDRRTHPRPRLVC
jgi:hypothetical protein